VKNITCYIDISDATGLVEVGFSYKFTTTDWSDWGVWRGDLPPGTYTFKATVPKNVWIDHVGQRLYHRWYAINKLGNRGDSPEYTGPVIVDDDVDPPLISDFYIEDESGDITVEATEKFRFHVELSDPSGVYLAEVHYDMDGELASDYITLPLNQIGDDKYATDYIGPFDGGKVIARVYAVDNDTDRPNDSSAGYSDTQQFIIYQVIIDRWVTTDDRCDVGSVQTISFHAKWAHNNSDIALGTIYVNGTGYVTNETGWVNFDVAYNTVGKRLWTVTSVSCHGITAYKQVTDNPQIIWDRIRILAGGVSDPRCDVGTKQTIWFTAEYEYDGVDFTNAEGILYINGTAGSWDPANGRWYITYSSQVVAKCTFVVDYVSDEIYGLSLINDLAGAQNIIWDRLVITLSLADDRIDVGTTMNWTFSAIYEYDGEPAVDYTLVYLNDTTTKLTVGKWTFSTEHISETQFNLSAFTSNSITCIWDRIKIFEGGVSAKLCDIGTNQTVWVRAVYEYDNALFDSSKGTIFMNGTVMSWSSSRNRWEYYCTSETVAELSFVVTSIVDSTYGLTAIDDMSGIKTIAWTALKVEDLILDRDIVYEGENITFCVKVVWAHNGSAVIGGLVSINGTHFGVTNSSGWAMITFRLDVCGSFNYIACAERDFTGAVTVCIKTISHSVMVKIPGDINGDGKVDIKDIAIVAAAFGSYPGHAKWNSSADLNYDEKIDIRDIAIAATNFGRVC